jgi:hypothetical protein
MDVFINSDDARSPQYRWDRPQQPQQSQGRGRGPQHRPRR